MKKICVLIIAYNEEDYVKLSLKTLRVFAASTDISAVVIDCFSNDGLRQWAMEQTNFNYLYVDEQIPFGKILNEVINEMQIDTDILIMKAGFLVTPGAIEEMLEVLYQSELVGVVAPISNAFQNYQRISDIGSFDAAVKWASSNKQKSVRQVLGLDSEALMLKWEMVNKIGLFDEKINQISYIMKDYLFRAVMNDWKLMVCNTALFWSFSENNRYVNVEQNDICLLEQKWGMHYFNTTYNENLIMQITDDSDAHINVLEIGCDCGATLLEIKNRFPNACIYGSELNENAAAVAAHFAQVFVNNIEECNLKCSKHSFDYIIFGDVLEHLHDPLLVLIYCKELLKSDGKIIASIPNLMHISVIEELLNGNFRYTETGLLDKTHIHFFTFNEIVRCFTKSGYDIENVSSILFEISDKQRNLINKLLPLSENVKDYMYESFQFIVKAKINYEK